MSLDVSLYLNGECVYDANITHNLTTMADKANIYEVIWRPEEIGCVNANHIISHLEKGLNLLVSRKEYFEEYNSPNGWGMYEHFVPFVEKYLEACKNYPDALIEIQR